VNQAVQSPAAYDSGSGASTLLLLHGLGGTWHIWKPVLGLLEKHHRVVALTLPGHLDGPALPAGQPVTVDAMADALEQDLRARGIERPHVAGNSLGGWLALELARRGQARSVTALSPAGGWRTAEDYRKVEKPFRIVFALMAVLIFLTTLFLGFAALRRALNKQAMEHGDRMPVPEFRRAMHSMRHTRMLPDLLTSMRDRGGIRPLDPGDTPVSIAWCEQDKVIPFQTYGQPVLDAVQGARSVIVKGVGHVPMYDDPVQVSEVILATTRAAQSSATARPAAA
jgi:pimeloyl-ACP methyl ester carboxylesterase